MKRILLILGLSVLNLWMVSISAQSCLDDISTDPRNPSNTDRPAFENSFYWFPNNGNNHSNFEIITPGATYPNINSPFWAIPTTLPVGQIADQQLSDFYPEDGWELLKVNFGKHNDGTQRSILPNMPYMALYNKYSGTIRFVGMWPNVSNSWQIIRFKVSIPSNRISPDDSGDPLDASNLLSIQGEAAQPLDQKTEENVYEIITEFPGISNAGYFFWFDLPVAYDPCICQNDVAIQLQASVENNWDLTIKGILDAQILQKGIKPSGSNHSQLVTKRIIGAAVATFGAIATQGSVVDVGAYKDLIQVFADRPGIDDKTKSQLTFLNGILSSAAEVSYDSTKLEWRNTVTGDTLSNKDWEKLFSGLGSFLNSGVDFFSPTEKAGQPRSSVVGTITATGTATLNIPSGDIVYWGVPGSNLSSSLNETVTSTTSGLLPEYPIYDNPLGTFALLNTPKINVKILDAVPIFSAFYTDPISGLTECDKPYNDRLQVFFGDEPIHYAFNPTLNINEELSSVKASIVIKANLLGSFHSEPLGNPAFGSYCGNDIPLYNQEMEWYKGVNLYKGVDPLERISPPVSIDEIGEVAATFLAEGEYNHAESFKYFIRFSLDLVSNNLDRDGKRIKNTQVISFPVEPILFSYFDPIPIDEIDIQNDLDPTEYSSPTVLSNGQMNYNPDYIHISSSISSPFPLVASITSGSVIHLTPGAHIEPKMRLNIGSPFQGLYPHPPASSSFINSFCNNQIADLTYQANQFSGKAIKLPPISSEILNRFISNEILNPVSIHPNPANSQIWINSTSTSISEVQIMDISGRVLIHEKPDDIDVNKILVNISSLHTGIYIVQTKCGNERNSQKLVVGK